MIAKEARVSASRLIPELWNMGTVLWIAWILEFYTGDIYPANAADNSQGLVLAGYTVSTAMLCVLMLLAAVRDRSFFGLVKNPNFVMGMGALASFGVFGCWAAARWGLGLVPFCLGAALTGAGTAFTCLALFRHYAEYDPRRIIITSGMALILGLLVYNFVCQLPYPALVVATVLLPLAASFTAMVTESVQEFIPDNGSHQLPKGFGTLVAGLFILICAASFMRGYAIGGLEVEEFKVERIYVCALLVLFCLVLLTAGILFGKDTTAGRILNIILKVAVCLLIALWLVPFEDILSYALFDALSGVLFQVVWIVSAVTSYKTSVSFMRTCGFGWGLGISGSILGWLAGSFLASWGADKLVIEGIAIAAVCIVALFLVSEKRLESMLSVPIENADFVLPADPQVPVPEEKRPAFRERCDAICEHYRLTAREVEIFRLMARGIETRIIAERCCISYNTARTHIRNIYGKLGVHSHQEFSALVSSDEPLKS
ncbi:MAG: helix-turn-helix transcriptional regulator [Coriobacteriales bacterium]